MRRSNLNLSVKQNRSVKAGFTLIEVLIVSPLVILIIMGFVGLMVNLVSDVLISRDRSLMTYNANQSLAAMSQDTNFSLGFIPTTGTVTNPQGNPSSAAFTSSQPNILLLRRVATDKKPLDASRLPVYVANTGSSPVSCGVSQSSNETLKVTLVYFVKDDTLWQRTIVPSYTTSGANQVCASVWQRNSCSEVDMSQPICKATDTKLMDNVKTLDVQYFSNANATTTLSAAQAATAGVARLTITSEKQTAGKTVTTSTSRLVKTFGQ